MILSVIINDIKKAGLKEVLYLVFFLFPFFIAGFKLANYPFSIVLIPLIILPLLLREVYEDLFYIYGVLLLYFLGITAFRASIEDFVPSLLSFALVTYPLIFKSPDINLHKSGNVIFYSFLIVLFTGFIQLAGSLAGYNNILSVISPLAKETAYYKDILPRVSATFIEPAHLVVFLITVYLIIDNFPQYFSGSKRNFLRYSTILLLILSLSLKGFALFISYYIAKFLFNLISNKIRKRSFKNLISITSVLAIVLLFNAFTSSKSYYSKIQDVFVKRVDMAVSAVEESKFRGSEGVRLNVIRMPLIYSEKEGAIKAFIGSGFAQHDEWLSEAFAGTDLVFAKGKIHNVYVTVFISGGIIGLLLFILFQAGIMIKSRMKPEVALIIFLFFMSSGYLILYLNWIPLLLLKTFYDNQQNKQSDHSYNY